MSDDVNVMTVSGRVTRKPEVRETPSGAVVMDFSIACNRYINSTQQTTYFKATLWNKAAEHFGERLNTGDHVILHGRLVDDNFTQADRNQTSGRLKIDSPHVTIVNRVQRSAEETVETTPEQVPEV